MAEQATSYIGSFKMFAATLDEELQRQTPPTAKVKPGSDDDVAQDAQVCCCSGAGTTQGLWRDSFVHVNRKLVSSHCPLSAWEQES
ncbi:hypothetical protein ACET1Q_23145 [Escherichia coli]